MLAKEICTHSTAHSFAEQVAGNGVSAAPWEEFGLRTHIAHPEV